MDKIKVEVCVEQLCQAGCRRVRELIDVLARGKQLPETAGLSEEEREAVLGQLREVMAVYDMRREWPGGGKAT